MDDAKRWQRRTFEEWLREAEERQRAEFTADPVRIHPRSPLGAVALSLVVPGLGSLYSGAWTGILVLAVNLAGLLLFLAGYLPGALLFVAGYIVGLVHAHQSATRWNRLRGILS